MKTPLSRGLRAAAAALVLAGAAAWPGCATAGSAPAPVDPALRDPEKNSAVKPVPRDANWLRRHEGFVAIAKAGGVDVLFLGDSITDFWRNRGLAVWNREFAPLHAANFGISADRTQHVLWRLEHGELDGLHPKVVVLLIGTNNTGFEASGAPRNTTAETIEGITEVVAMLRAKRPETKILLLGLFPRADAKGPPPESGVIPEINAALAKLADGRRVRFLDFGAKFLGPDGRVAKELFPDLLHPNQKGYEIWADAIKGPLAEMMR